MIKFYLANISKKNETKMQECENMLFCFVMWPICINFVIVIR